MENNFEQSQETDISQDLLSLTDQYVDATQGQRFVNWLVDNLLIRFALDYLGGIAISYFLLYAAPDFLASITEEGESGAGLILFSLLVGYFNYLIYYTFCEKVFKGYTSGKLLTGTKAVRADGSELRFKDALLRSLSRIVPFEVFSGLGARPWHDSWTNTSVIKTR
jgi:uncharacterized RDD family membrane protein YckC